MPARYGATWSVFVPGVTAGTRYGFRVDGPWDPDRGYVFNPAKLLIDPYARATTGAVRDYATLSAFVPGSLSIRDDRDSAADTLLGIVLPPVDAVSPKRRTRPSTRDLIIYEAHVRGLTARHPDVPDALRGTFAGAAHPAVLEHLTNLGINAVEFLPVQQGVSEPFLAPLGLTNYWNYSPIAWFAPHAEYSAEVRAGRIGHQVEEFQAMVHAFHEAGIAVLLDVVYNHTAEGQLAGPMLSLRGLANHEYYRLDPFEPAQYLDTTGCGNAIRTEDPLSLRLILDSLRYWVDCMGVDGFRFDLATTLGREHGDFHWSATFFDAIHADPLLRSVILIDEPWDVGRADSHQTGGFPPGWHDWNDRYRDAVRDFWRGRPGVQRDLAHALSGSAGLFGWRHQGPQASVNFVTAHDGFTLADLVSFHDKRNDANGQENTDGTSDNRSWNCGVEGPTTEPAILELRGQQARSLIASLLLSWGIPMITMGDELGRTQQGNNNAYCQDNELSWVDWPHADRGLTSFVQDLIAFRVKHPVLRSTDYPGERELIWFRPDGAAMEADDWHDPSARSLAWAVTPNGRVDEAAFVVLCNAWTDPVSYHAPLRTTWANWRVQVATGPAPLVSGDVLTVPEHSLSVLVSSR